MRIESISNKYTFNSFKGAELNLLATSDNHGNVHSLPKFVKTIETHKSTIFQNSDKPSTLNVFAIAGDWFINPSKKGFKTKPNMTNGDVQLKFLKDTISFVKKAAGENSKFETIFAMGNHDLDGGDKFMIKVAKEAPMKTLITNVDMPNSFGMVKALSNKKDSVAKSFVFDISDDKNPKMKHSVLFVGSTIPTMDFYNPGLLKDMQFYDNGNLKDDCLTEEDIQGTIQSISHEVKNFKKKNPKGAVVLLSHMGDRLSKIVTDNVPQINVVLNGHDHMFKTSLKGNTNINSLGKDNEMIKALNIKFNDEGELDTIDMNTYFSDLTLIDDLDKHPMQLKLNDSFSEDVKPLVKIIDTTGKDEELDYGNEVRYSNSYLANYLTSAVKSSVEKIYPAVTAVGVQSSIIRGGIKNGANNLDLMKVFDGVSENLSSLKIGEVSGYELAGLITENVQENLKAPTRNTLIHWSDIQVNKSLIKKISEGKSEKKYINAIKVRDENTQEFVPIDKNKVYTIVISEKYLIKDDIKWPKKIRNNFIPLGKTYDELFREHLNESGNVIKITERTEEQRVL